MDDLVLILMLLAAAVAAFAVPFAMVIGEKVSSGLSDSWRIAAILAAISLGALLVVVATPRDLANVVDVSFRLESGQSNLTIWIGRFFNALLVAFCLAWLFNAVWLRRRTGIQEPAQPLIISATIYFCGVAIVNAVGSSFTSINYKSLYIPIVLTSIYLLRSAEPLVAIRVVKAFLLIVCVSSLIAVGLRPDFVIERPYPTGLIPGINFRLYGLTPHANSLGPIALLYLILEAYAPMRSSMRWLCVLPVIVCLVLAQSKTAWAAGFVLCAVAFVWKMLDQRTRVPDRVKLLYLAALTGAASLILAALPFLDVSGFIERHSEFASLTGRTDVWRITLEEWERNPSFGYGAGLWSEEYRERLGLIWVGQAHNQFVQTMGEAGLFGLAFLLQYMGTLLVHCLKLARETTTLPLTLFVFILMRCISESPMNVMGLLEWPFLAHALLFHLTAQFVRQEALTRPAQSPPGALSPVQAA